MPGLRPFGSGPYGADEWPAPLTTREVAGAAVVSFILSAGLARAWTPPAPCEVGTWREAALT